MTVGNTFVFMDGLDIAYIIKRFRCEKNGVMNRNVMVALIYPVNLHSHLADCGASLGQCPWLRADDLSFTVRPEEANHADNVVQSCVGALVEQESRERAERVDDQAGLNGAVETSSCEKREGPFPSEGDDTEDHVDDLEKWDRFYGGIQVLGGEIPEDLGPDEGFDCSC
jgi:hypothetical protein